MNLIEVRKAAFKWRGGIWTAFYLVIFFLAKPIYEGVLLGLMFVIAGQAIRFWAAGSIGLYRGVEVKASCLVTWGPYAFVRNPLYLGNGIIGLGWAMMAGGWSIPVFIVAFVLIYCFLVIPYEENFLEEKFGDEYLKYKAKTGSLVPRRLPSKEEVKGPFSFEVLLKSERHSLHVTVAGTVLLVTRLWW